MSDKLLSDVHPLEKLLEESVGEPLLDGGDVLLHVLQTPEGEGGESTATCRKEDSAQREAKTASPGHGVSVELQELQQVLGLLPVSGLLLSRQGVIWHQQGMSAPPFQKQKTLRISRSSTITCRHVLTRSHLWPAAPASSSGPRCCDSSLPAALP